MLKMPEKPKNHLNYNLSTDIILKSKAWYLELINLSAVPWTAIWTEKAYKYNINPFTKIILLRKPKKIMPSRLNLSDHFFDERCASCDQLDKVGEKSELS